MNQKQTPETVYSPLFSHKIMVLEPPIPVACVAGAKREGGEEEKLVRSFFPSSLSPTTFIACYAGYLLMAILLSSVPICCVTFKKIWQVFSFASRSHVGHRRYQLRKRKDGGLLNSINHMVKQGTVSSQTPKPRVNKQQSIFLASRKFQWSAKRLPLNQKRAFAIFQFLIAAPLLVWNFLRSLL